MAAVEVEFHGDDRGRLLRGADILANAVSFASRILDEPSVAPMI